MTAQSETKQEKNFIVRFLTMNTSGESSGRDLPLWRQLLLQLLCLAIAIEVLFPIMYVVTLSFSSKTTRPSALELIPKEISLDAYKQVIDRPTANPVTFLELLKNSDEIILAIDEHTGKVAGFITALTDRTLSAYIPFLEVLPAYQGQGVGKELVRRMLERLSDLYAVDLLCDPELQSFYEGLGMRRAYGMMIRNYDRQAGR